MGDRGSKIEDGGWHHPRSSILDLRVPSRAFADSENRGSFVTEALIIGCGVSGLSCGIRLLEAGYRARIWARDLPPRTTSNVAAAIWYPYRAFPLERVGAWGAQTFAELVRLAAQPDTGVRSRSGIEIFPQPVGD